MEAVLEVVVLQQRSPGDDELNHHYDTSGSLLHGEDATLDSSDDDYYLQQIQKKITNLFFINIYFKQILNELNWKWKCFNNLF